MAQHCGRNTFRIELRGSISRNSCVRRIKQKSLLSFAKLRENSSLARSTPVGDFSQTPVHTCVRATLRGVTCAIFISYYKSNGRATPTTLAIYLSGAAAALPTRHCREAAGHPHTAPAGARPPGGHTPTHPHTHTGVLNK